MTSGVYAHFIGIGGAGMSGLARVLHDRGIAVTGSDLKESRYTLALQELGVPVAIGHDASNLGDPEVVVVSSAIPERNPEYAEALRRGLPVWPRARMLAHLAEERRTVAIAGTHGKTTTSSMVAAMLAAAGESPSFLIGGEVGGFASNAMHGDGDLYVVEADESDGSFVYLAPHVAVITNIEADHLDHYAGIEEIEETFAAFVARIPSGGTLVACADDERVMKLAGKSGVRVVTYGRASTADVRCTSVERTGEGMRFDVTFENGQPLGARIAVPGEHMALNATAALAVAHVLGLDPGRAVSALESFEGVKRRFDHIGEALGVRVVDDYAHHPTEVRATLGAARDVAADNGRLWVVFQPHRYSRTQAFVREFGESFGSADRVIIMDVYSAGETPIPGVSGKTVVDAILRSTPRARVAYLPHRRDIAPYLARGVRSGDLVMTMGAGDVTTMGAEVLRELGEPDLDGASCQ